MADNLIDVPDDNLANVSDTNLVDVPEESPSQPAMTAQQRYRQTLKAYHDQGTENPDVAPGYVSPETSKAFAEDKANIPQLGAQWGDVGIGAAKGVAGGLSGGLVGDIESLGRLPFQIPGVREYIADVSPHTVIPTSEEGGYLGPRGVGAFKAPETGEEKGGAFIGSLLTPFAATAPLKALRGTIKLSSSAAEIANAAERQGISIPRAAITDNRDIQTAAGYLKEIPFVGTPLVKASEEALSGIEDVADRTVSALGSGNKLRAGDIASDAIEGWITGKSKTIATELYDAVDPLVNPEFTRPLFETKKVANEIAAKRANAKIKGDSPAIREIEDALASPGMNYDGVKDLRTYIRDMTPQEMVAKNINKGEAKRIYDALTSDLRATVLDAGGPDALKKFDKANNVYNIIADRRASIAKVIGVSADAASEKVIDRITAMAGNAGSADYQTLQKVRKSIGPKSWDEVSSAILAKMGRANPEAAFSADQFVTAWNKLSPSSKQLLFNSTNRPGIINDLNDLVTLSSAQKNLSKYANPSGSGRLTTFGSMIVGAWAAPLTTIATIVGGRQMAKFFASPIAVKSTAQWAKANNAAFTTPNTMTTARLLSASGNIAETLNREFGGNFSAKDFIPPGQGNEQPRATGGSVFDKMHMARKRAEGGGTDVPFNEWDDVPRNAEGIPQIRIEKPQADEARTLANMLGAPAGEDQAFWDLLRKRDNPDPFGTARDDYNTPLSADEQPAFDAWKAKNSPNDSGFDYDLPGAFKAGFTRDNPDAHMGDQFKKPNHPTFSDQSQYAANAPSKAGTWDGDTYVPRKTADALWPATKLEAEVQQPPMNPFFRAAASLLSSGPFKDAAGAPYEPTPPSTEGKTWMMEPGKYAVQSGNYEMPPNVRLNDADIPYNVETGKELQMVRRPSVLPLTRTPDGVQWAMPKVVELAGDIVNPLAVTKGVALNPGEFALGSGPIKSDPKLWHGISKIKLPKPISEMNATRSPIAEIAEKQIVPSDLQGGLLLPAIGDRSIANANLHGFNGYKFEEPVPMQGGHGFMAANADKDVAWASGSPVIGRIASDVRKLNESGNPIYFPYTAMGERSVDFSHHISSTLAEALKQQPLTRNAERQFNAAMKSDAGSFGAVKNWPGVNSPYLKDYLLSSKGDVRNKFAKLMDTNNFQSLGFPNVAEARFAATDPRLLNAPTGAAGISVSKLDPSGKILKDVSGHLTYDTDLGGKYVGGLGRSIPKEVFYPDLLSAYKKLNYEPFQYDYLMSRGVTGAPRAQKANQKWVDNVSKWIEKNPKEETKFNSGGSVFDKMKRASK
jgi:hypothetical protein